MMVSAFTGILTSRFILHALGITDFGVYSVVLGVTVFLGFINDAMVIGTQRFIAYYQGRNDLDESKSVFNTCLVVHAIIAVVVILLVETAGVWILRNKLVIPAGRMPAAEWTLQCALIMSVAGILSVPYSALMSSHEAFLWISISGVFQSIITLGIAILLSALHGDRLIWYATFLTILVISVSLVNIIYCHIKYPESQLDIKNGYNKSLARTIISFSSWNLIGVISGVVRTQGIVFIFNIFGGPRINAAYGLANQATGMLGQISGAMLRAVSPQVLKNEGSGNREKVLDLAFRASRLAFLLDALWIIPLYTEMPFILNLWLTKVPPHTVSFCRLVLLGFILDKLTIGFITVVQAIGRIAFYQIVLGITQIMVFPAGYLLLKNGYQPETVLIASTIIALVVVITRVWFLKKLAGVSVGRWFSRVVSPALLSVIPGIVCMLSFLYFLPSESIRLPFTLIIGSIITTSGIWYIGMMKDERSHLLGVCRLMFSRLRVYSYN